MYVKVTGLLAIAAAFHKGNAYHRDISLGNVMMTEQKGDSEGPWGVLNDWDQASWTNSDQTERIVSSTSSHICSS